MILADKIIVLRKKNGWSQEALADKMNVSRQAVSKWEGAQTIPDLEKILQLAALFGVTTDYLLKDELEHEEYIQNSYDGSIKRVSLADANNYLSQRKTAAKKIALATFFLILSPITLLILGAMSETSIYGVSETVAGIIGIIVVLVFAICAIPIYIDCGFKNKQFEFLDKSEPFELEYGVRGMVKEQQSKYRNTYVRGNIAATCLCIIAVIPFLAVSFTENLLLIVAMLCVLIAVAGFAVSLFIMVGVRNASMEKLLQKGDYTAKNKQKEKFTEMVGCIYWGILTAIYLAWSFLAEAWKISWVIFAVGGVLFPVVLALCNLINRNK